MPSFRLSELATAVGGTRDGPADPVISGAAAIDCAGPGDITFLRDDRLQHHLNQTQAAAVVLRPGVECPVPALRVDDPHGAFALILQRFAPPKQRLFPVGIHPTAVVDPSARLGEDVAIGAFTVIGENVTIGAGTALGAHVVIGPDVAVGPDCLIYPLVTVREGCILGRGVILHAGAVIGSDGFGFLPGPGGLRKVPQIGCVVLEDGVEVGANSCIDRATTGRTVVGMGTKIDNLVQVAHNVVIGRHCALSAQTGLSGSCQIGDGVTMAGQVGVADHRRIGDGATLAAQAGIDRDVEAGQTVFGSPAVEFKRAYKLVALTHRLPDIAERLRKLEQAVFTGRDQGED